MTEAGADPEPSDLQRLHVLTPWLQSWRYLLAGLGAVVAIFRDDVRRLGEVWEFVRDQPLLLSLLIGLGTLLLVGGVVVGWAFLAWRMTGYAVVGQTLFVRSGVVVRQRRQVRLNRLQGVDVSQPLLARLCGLAALKLELAAGSDATTTLGYLTLTDAHALRRDLLERSGRHRVDPHTGVPVEEPEQTVLTVPTTRVLQARLLEASLAVALLLLYVVGAITVVLLVGGGFGAVLAVLAPAAPALLAVGSQLVTRFLQESNFSVGESADGLRIHSGLLALNHRTVPRQRVQGMHIGVPLMWRPTGWARLTVDVAGSVSSGSGSDSMLPAANTLVPVASMPEVTALFTRISRVRLDEVALAPAPRRTRWLDPFGYGWLGVGLTESVAITRTGWLTRRCAVVPYARIQSVRVTQGPLQRRLALASVHLDGAVGATGWTAPHRSIDDAQQLVHLLAARALSARHAEH
ncbi:MAG TPA: PH domain-containing protein [Nocardioidaceae bacterium]|nr:PH domain-containing protein [Nocardioidaceae bacterium]